ncbi:NRAMP family divalent metal transporter [Undibacterium rugosum]|uniref:NRAMP family divalent metal transporter n=1 Tax=Undibacterium rugosum TaxID=2762291 RepID=UPI001E2C4DC9|nr:divalent metal cation transporter [Undibacterium rugosum]
MTTLSPSISFSNRSRWTRFIAVAGPGLVVMLADTDAGSVITAAQSGAQWGYQLLLLQLILAPILFVVQELTVRLGIVSGKGHGDLIQQHFGRGWALVSVGTLVIACIGALLSELSGLAGVGLLFGIPAQVTMAIVVSGLIIMAFTGSYLSVERIAMCVGAFELVFLIVAWYAKPELSSMVSGSLSIPWREPKYLYLVAANIGAVIMPWMVFYQQSAVVEKKLTIDDLPAARWDTAVGSVITQVIMAAVLIATAATLGKSNSGAALDTVQQIAQAITPFLGEETGKILFALGMVGSALVATIVVTLTAARSLGEVLGVKHSLDLEPKDAPWFYGIFTTSLVIGGLFVASGVNLVSLSVGVQVMNALLLPIVLGFLYLLARRLPEAYRLKGPYAIVVALVILFSAGFGVFAGLSGAV